MRLHWTRLIFVILVVILTAGCATPTPAPTVAPTAVVVLPTQTPYPTSTLYPTYTPFPTLPPTQTSTPVPTATATSTPTATPTRRPVAQAQPAAPAGSANLWRTPGGYPLPPQCVYYPDSFSGRIWDVNFCIIRVDVYDFGLRFYGHWKLKLTVGSFESKSGTMMHPKSTSFAYYVVDDRGNKYMHTRTGGAADSDWPVQSPDYLMGYDDQNSRPTVPISWWEFAPAQPGASSFTFVDDEHGVKVGPIVLSQ